MPVSVVTGTTVARWAKQLGGSGKDDFQRTRFSVPAVQGAERVPEQVDTGQVERSDECDCTVGYLGHRRRNLSVVPPTPTLPKAMTDSATALSAAAPQGSSAVAGTIATVSAPASW